MKYKVFFLLIFMALSASAKIISLDNAKRMAVEFFQNKTSQRIVKKLQMVYDGETEFSRSAGVSPALYVFNNPDGKGFVIVAGDDLAEPILGYSYEHVFPEGNLPPNVEGWLCSLKKQINDGRKWGVVSKPSSRALGTTGEVVAQLKTAMWNQGYPYNQYCPVVSGEKAPTGCVITAAAIVMHYYKWPEKGTGTLPGYTTMSSNVEVPAVQLGHVYDWDEMILDYQSGKYTIEQGEQVSRLMADLGVMMQADYGKYGTAASSYYLGRLLSTYMGYDKSAVRWGRSETPDEEWHQMLQQELRDGHPIVYDGHNDEYGHTFVLDGYTTKQFYSVNWGWGGYCNGYFLLNALVPEGSGIGGNGEHYNFYQSAVIGLKPDEGGDYIERMLMIGNGLSSSVEQVQKNKPFDVVVTRIENGGGTYFNGTILWALTDKNGNIKEHLATLECKDLQPGWGWENLKKSCMVTVPIVAGDRIRMFYKSRKTPQWTLIKSGNQCTWELLVVERSSIEALTKLRYNKKDRLWTITSQSGVDVLLVSDTGNVLKDRCVTKGNVTTINTQGLSAGTYVIRMKNSFDSCDVRIKLGDS